MDFQQNTQPEVQSGQTPVENPQTQGQPATNGQQPNQGPALGAQPSGNSSYNNMNNNNTMNNNPYNHNPYQNGYPNNGSNYNRGYNNNNPYYNRNMYQMPVVEPGSSLYSAAFVLGIIAIIACFTFTVYPAFILGSIAIVLALLSKGKNAKMHSKASVGVICAVAALVLNTLIVTYSVTTVLTNPEMREEVNDACEEIYGMSFDEMIEEIMEESGMNY